MTFGSSFSKKVHCIHILWCIFMWFGHNDPWVESHMWPQQMWGQRSSRGQWPLVQVFFCKKGHCIRILWCIFMGLGHNDPWVESHIRPQQMWGQRSSMGQWPLVQVFEKTVTVSTYFHVCSGETRGSRTTCLHYQWGHFGSFLKVKVFYNFVAKCQIKIDLYISWVWNRGSQLCFSDGSI